MRTELHKVTHDVVQETLARADVVIDQLRVGFYGVYAQEAMARGKPLVVYVREDLREKVLGYDRSAWPLVPSSAYELKGDLRRLFTDAAERQRLSLAARKFIEEKHDASKALLTILDLIRCACPHLGEHKDA